MSNYKGDFALGATVRTMFTTVNVSAVPTTLAGTPAIGVYEDNSTTEITAGVTLTVDFDGKTGLNLVEIVASTANGFEVGKDYHVVITTGTVSGNSVVGYVVGAFSIQARSADVARIAGTAISEGAAGRLAAAFSKLFDVATPTLTAASRNQTGDAYDALTAAQAEPSAAPVANASPLAKLAWLGALARNKIVQTLTSQALRNDADSADIATASITSDSGTSTTTRGEWQ